MTELESHTLAWMRKLDEKFDQLREDTRTGFADLRKELVTLQDELLVLNGIVLRLEGREVETTGLKRLYDRHERLLADILQRVEKLEGEKEP